LRTAESVVASSAGGNVALSAGLHGTVQVQGQTGVGVTGGTVSTGGGSRSGSRSVAGDGGRSRDRSDGGGSGGEDGVDPRGAGSGVVPDPTHDSGVPAGGVSGDDHRSNGADINEGGVSVGGGDEFTENDLVEGHTLGGDLEEGGLGEGGTTGGEGAGIVDIATGTLVVELYVEEINGGCGGVHSRISSVTSHPCASVSDGSEIGRLRSMTDDGGRPFASDGIGEGGQEVDRSCTAERTSSESNIEILDIEIDTIQSIGLGECDGSSGQIVDVVGEHTGISSSSNRDHEDGSFAVHVLNGCSLVYIGRKGLRNVGGSRYREEEGQDDHVVASICHTLDGG